MLTSLTRSAGTIALVGAAFWIMSAVAGSIGQGSLLTPWTDRNYAIWSGITAFAVLCSYVALVAVANRTGTGREPATIVALAIGLVGVFLMVVGTWGWVATAIPLVVAFAWAVRRVRVTGGGRPALWLLVAAWPVGAATWWLMHQMKVGPQDSYGDYSAAFVAGYATAATLFAIGLAYLGSWLRTDSSAEEPAEFASA